MKSFIVVEMTEENGEIPLQSMEGRHNLKSVIKEDHKTWSHALMQPKGDPYVPRGIGDEGNKKG